MCGIIGYIGFREGTPVILKGLERLSYRGYDSAGIAFLDNQNKLCIFKQAGKVKNLIDTLQHEPTTNHIAIGHTRWATHGAPTATNAHPQLAAAGKLAIIHNGIIENYHTLKKELLKKGYTFKSETDTEVLANLIEAIQIERQCTLEEAVKLALKQVIGAYAIAILSADMPEKIIVAKKSSPLLIGIGKNELFVASDATPILEYTNQIIYLKDNEIAFLKPNELLLQDRDDTIIPPYIEQLNLTAQSIEKSGFDHFMLKEIFEQPNAMIDCMRGRLELQQKCIKLGGITDYMPKITKASRITIIACGTSWLAGMVAKYAFEELCRIPIEVAYASEFRYSNPIIAKGDIVIAISQSGETADTLAAMQLAKERDATVLSICNVVGSSIARVAHAGLYTHAGPEIGVASTKAFTTQLIVLMLLALSIAEQKKTISKSVFNMFLKEIHGIPAKAAYTLDCSKKIATLAHSFRYTTNALYLGRGYNYPIALEGALKLKELSYIHAEGYPAAEMKHGPIALIDQDMPVIFIATKDRTYEKIISNIEEVKTRKGYIIAIVNEGDDQVKALADQVIEIPTTHETLMPILSVIPLQLLAYYIAIEKGCNVDQPRNLAKSVTVE